MFLNENNYDQHDVLELPNMSMEHDNVIKPEETNIEKVSNFINNTTTKLIDKINDRYNRKKDKHVLDDELYDIIKLDDANTDNEYTKKINDYTNDTINNQKNMDSKINAKNKKSQSLFKDALTIRNNYTKNSIKGDFVDELNYYENLRTPWWYEATEEINY